jgi:hypothetical protein
MKCHEATRRLDLFMDGELAVPENLQVLEHLNLCRPCAGVFEGEKRLRASLKSRLGGLRAPEALAGRLSAALRGDVEPFRPAASGRWGMVAAAALFFMIVGSLVVSPSPKFQLLAAEISERHALQAYACGAGTDEARCLCASCTKDPGSAIRSFFAKHEDRDYCAHLAEAAKLGYTWQGVAAWRCRGEEVLWSTWRTSSGAKVSHALVVMDLGGTPRFCRRGGRPVLFYPRGDKARPDLACVFVFEDVAEAERFVRALGMPGP